MDKLTVEYSVEQDGDTSDDVIMQAIVDHPFELVLTDPEGKSHKVILTAVLAHPTTVKA